MGLLVTTGAAAAASSLCMPSNSMISSGVLRLFDYFLPGHQVSLPLSTWVEVSQVSLHVSLPTVILPPLQNSLLPIV